MDRMDYTKGIPERLKALDRFFKDNPEYCGSVVFIQAGMPSRTQIDTYQQIGQRIDDLIDGINKKYGTDSWQPVVPMTRQLSRDTLNALRRLARSTNRSIAALIRTAVDQYLQRAETGGSDRDDPLWRIIGIAADADSETGRCPEGEA